MDLPIRKSAKKMNLDEEDEMGHLGMESKKVLCLRAHIEYLLRNLLEAIEAVRRGDLTKRLGKQRYDIFGEIADSYNGMMESLNTFTSEVTRVAREVGREGKLGGQAAVPV